MTRLLRQVKKVSLQVKYEPSTIDTSRPPEAVRGEEKIMVRKAPDAPPRERTLVRAPARYTDQLVAICTEEMGEAVRAARLEDGVSLAEMLRQLVQTGLDARAAERAKLAAKADRAKQKAITTPVKPVKRVRKPAAAATKS